MCDTREAWCRKISFRTSVYVILGKPGAGILVLDLWVCNTREAGVGILVLDIVCVILEKPGIGKISFRSSVYVILGKPGAGILVLDLWVCNTREAWCRTISLRSRCM